MSLPRFHQRQNEALCQSAKELIMLLPQLRSIVPFPRVKISLCKAAAREAGTALHQILCWHGTSVGYDGYCLSLARPGRHHHP